MSIALVFPGQASQLVGMLGAMTACFSRVRECFDQASGALGFDLWKLVCEGPAERLNSTEFTQPAVLVAGVATWRVWRDQGGAAPALVSGHSLGGFLRVLARWASFSGWRTNKGIKIRRPKFRYLSAMDCTEHVEPADIRATLAQPLANPVRWTTTVRAVLAVASIVIECGPGKVLTGLNRRIERTATCYALEDPDSLTAALAATTSNGNSRASHASL
ncbi:MAG TPA: acyltransferase domain-containing protein [Steroidobacteraceae bacterium]|jgi:malonyl CoA-acyl carrier protein transacylase|nr:acyltransferase domain-containing protein [Steroidobacteraceae bacterium]